jgi:hypothetical protein
MGENQAYQSQVHVTALRYLRVKHRTRGLSRRLKPVLQGWGAGSHTLSNHVIRKRTVNTTLARGHHAQTRHTSRNFSNLLHDSSMPNETVRYYFLTGEDDTARFDSRRYNKVSHSLVYWVWSFSHHYFLDTVEQQLKQTKFSQKFSIPLPDFCFHKNQKMHFPPNFTTH